jgi:hypothetical protein
MNGWIAGVVGAAVGFAVAAYGARARGWFQKQVQSAEADILAAKISAETAAAKALSDVAKKL